eukprot:596438-Ditylum_brightwellii.AAC.1
MLDIGKEFIAEFSEMILKDHGVKKRPTTVRNPQANSIIERIVNLSPVSKGSNPDIENWDNVQSTMYSSAMPLAIEQ